jgi:hypothetical protein
VEIPCKHFATLMTLFLRTHNILPLKGKGCSCVYARVLPWETLTMLKFCFECCCCRFFSEHLKVFLAFRRKLMRINEFFWLSSFLINCSLILKVWKFKILFVLKTCSLWQTIFAFSNDFLSPIIDSFFLGSNACHIKGRKLLTHSHHFSLFDDSLFAARFLRDVLFLEPF